MGVPLSSPAQEWSFDEIEKSDSLTYAPVDEDSRQTLKDMQKLWVQAHKGQDFEKLSAIGNDIKTMLGVGNEILRLKRELQICVSKENYEKAIGIRNEMQKQELKRSHFEANYETSRFEDSVVLTTKQSSVFDEFDRNNDHVKKQMMEQ